MKIDLLADTRDKIENAYSELGYQLGWSFLYTPAKTLSPTARFLFMGMNPGGGEKSFSMSTEEGNAYDPKVEEWVKGGSPLQHQVVALYELLAARLNVAPKILMNATLAANFCPFRSTTWGELKKQNDAIAFSRALWAELLEKTDVTTIVCMSSVTFQQITAILAAKAIAKACEQHAAGWGNIKYHVKEYDMKGRRILVIGLPHLSRYQIFKRDASSSNAAQVANRIAESLKGWVPEC